MTGPETGTRAAVWDTANRLGVVAGTPGELCTALLAGPRRTVALPLPPDHQLVRDLRSLGHVALVLEEPAGSSPGPAPGPPDLADPAAVCAADPLRVTGAYEADPRPYGGLRAAWLRAGQSLIRDQDPAERALVLLAALDEDHADPPVAAALARAAARAPWRLTGSARRVCTALATGPGGRLVVRDDRVRAVGCLPDGTQLALDERGRLHRRGGPPDRLTDAVTATLDRHPATALAVMGATVVTGDRTGTVHAFSLAGLEQAAPHAGRVTALAATASVAYSGGADGAVHAWRPGRAPARTPVLRRACPVAALHAAGPYLAVAWADGTAELHHPGERRSLAFRPGPRVRAVAATAGGELVVGLDDALLRLAGRWSGRSRAGAGG
ncbi:WD40 repeat domain-containing protein [Streptomyces sp. NPDC015131]|uniref:WD40 repeat domain-containing protein n=1 Tax=Streptomyces sp. NPDC015131 TaxID=3364941 RepID=UPI0036F573F8